MRVFINFIVFFFSDGHNKFQQKNIIAIYILVQKEIRIFRFLNFFDGLISACYRKVSSGQIRCLNQARFLYTVPEGNPVAYICSRAHCKHMNTSHVVTNIDCGMKLKMRQMMVYYCSAHNLKEYSTTMCKELVVGSVHFSAVVRMCEAVT